MSATNAFETDLLELIFQGLTITSVAQNAAAPATSLYISLHTADPGETGDQTTSEATYTSYARVSVMRDATGFTVSGSSATNFAATLFPTCTGGTNTITHFGIGLDSTGAGTLLLVGSLTTPLIVTNTIAPVFQAGQLVASVD